MAITSSSGLGASINAGLEAYKQGSEAMSRASNELAQHSHQDRGQTNQSNQVNVNQAAVNLVSGELQAQAGAKVISRANDMLGSIIDTFA